MKKLSVRGPIIPTDYQEVYDYFGMEATSPGKISKAIAEANGDELDVEINSGGGDVFSGSEIYTALMNYSGKVTVSIVGIAASAASVIAMAGEPVRMSPTAQMMIHNVSGSADGDHREMEHVAEVLKNANDSIANAYMLKTGKDRKELLKLMENETWMTAKQAKEDGFIDEVMFDTGGRLAASVAGELPIEVIQKTLNELKSPPEQADFLIPETGPAGQKDEGKAMEQTNLEAVPEAIPQEPAIDQANQRALEEPKLINLENKSVEAKEARIMETMDAKVTSIMDVSSPEYRDAFMKKLQGKALTQMENAAVVASSVIPTETWNQIVRKAEAIAPIIGRVTVTQIPGNLTIPVESTVNDAAFIAMGTAATDGADELTYVSLAAYKLIKTVEIGADTMAMAVDAFESYIVDALSKKVAKAVENAIINGTGTNAPTGLLASGVITNTGTFTKLGMTYSDLLTIIGDLPDAGYRQGACFVMPSALFYSDVLPALTDKGSGLDVQAVEKMKVLGYDVILCDRVAANTIIFGDLSYFHWNWAAPVQIQSDASVAFRTGSTVYRALGLADGKVTNAAAFNKYTRAQS